VAKYSKSKKEICSVRVSVIVNSQHSISIKKIYYCKLNIFNSLNKDNYYNAIRNQGMKTRSRLKAKVIVVPHVHCEN